MLEHLWKERVSDVPRLDRLVARTADDQSDIINERALFLFDSNEGFVHYSHEFVQGLVDTEFRAAFVAAMSSLLTGSSDPSRSSAKTLVTSDGVYLVEHGEWSIGLIAASVERDQLRSQLKLVISEFESRFGTLRGRSLGPDRVPDFDDYVMRVFLADRIWERTLLKRTSNPDNVDVPEDVSRFTARLFSHGQTVREAADAQHLSIDIALELAMKACWSGALSAISPEPLGEVHAPTEKAKRLLFSGHKSSTISLATAQVVARMDGRTPTLSLLQGTPVEEFNRIGYELGALIMNGLVTRVSPGATKIVEYEVFMTRLLDACSDLVGSGVAFRYFEEARAKAAVAFPWVAAVKIRPGGKVECPTWGPGFLALSEDAVTAGLGRIVSTIKDQLSDDVGDERSHVVVDSIASSIGIDLGILGALFEFAMRIKRLIRGMPG
ncbi:MAG: hypothetical protein AM324_009420 [Candidatus Thorarchaeota archaeon SMTZ1-83]|nr:MAG: hypothetical protein AM324_10930 [Candidatus Thorarchaeota archaeon SMTZ1-83]